MIKRPKYRNTKCELNGIIFDSIKEKNRYIFLKDKETKGLISDLTLQPTFELIPKITEQITVHLKTKDKVVEKFIQHAITYTADFSYKRNGTIVVEDVKSSPKPYAIDEVFKIKEKLFRWKFGYSLKRIYKATEDI